MSKWFLNQCQRYGEISRIHLSTQLRIDIDSSGWHQLHWPPGSNSYKLNSSLLSSRDRCLSCPLLRERPSLSMAWLSPINLFKLVSTQLYPPESPLSFSLSQHLATLYYSCWFTVLIFLLTMNCLLLPWSSVAKSVEETQRWLIVKSFPRLSFYDLPDPVWQIQPMWKMGMGYFGVYIEIKWKEWRLGDSTRKPRLSQSLRHAVLCQGRCLTHKSAHIQETRAQQKVHRLWSQMGLATIL